MKLPVYTHTLKNNKVQEVPRDFVLPDLQLLKTMFNMNSEKQV